MDLSAVWQESVGLVHNLAGVLHAARSRHMNHYEVTCQEQVAALRAVFAAQPHELKDRIEALDSVAAFLIRAGCHVQAPGQTPVAIEALRRRASNHGSDIELVTSLLEQTDLCRVWVWVLRACCVGLSVRREPMRVGL